MEKLWSKSWRSSTQRRKQRKYNYNAPLHIKNKMMGTKLSKDLKKEYGIRTISVRKDDEVKVLVGDFKNKTAKVVRRNLKKTRIHLDGIGKKRSDGTISSYPIHPSNVEIVKLNLDDKLRVQKLNSLKEKMRGVNK